MGTSPLSALAEQIPNWQAPPFRKDGIPDSIGSIGPVLEAKAEKLFRRLIPLAAKAASENGRAVISLFGGSGAGKSGTVALLSDWLRQAGVGCVAVPGDNYPHRIPVYNDAERLRLFRVSGMKALRSAGLYSLSVGEALRTLWERGVDADPAAIADFPWLADYQEAGKQALRAYLGTEAEQDYAELNALLADFHNGSETLWLKRMGRREDERWYEPADVSDAALLLLEWTHGGSELLHGVDIPVLLLGSTEETLPYRRARNRDSYTDSPFTTMVLNIEQEKILRRAGSAALILTRSGEWADAAAVLEGCR